MDRAPMSNVHFQERLLGDNRSVATASTNLCIFSVCPYLSICCSNFCRNGMFEEDLWNSVECNSSREISSV